MTKRTKRLKPHVWMACLIAVCIASCSGQANMADAARRARRAARAKGDVVIGVAWPFSEYGPMLRHGVEMAVEETNAAGGVLGRNVRAVWIDDANSVVKGRLIAQRFSDDLDVVAVIGHADSVVSISTSATYQFAGLLMLSPGATNPQLTQQEFDLVFRNVPTDEEIGKQLADFAAGQGYKRMAILAVKDAYGRGLANTLERQADKLGITIVDRQSYTDQSVFSQILTRWQALECDAIFLAASLPEGAVFIRQARDMGVKVPMLGGDGLDAPDLWEVGREAAEGTVVAALFHPDTPWPELSRFNAAFQKKYSMSPDASAALGYDAIKLLAYAMTQAGSTVPARVAEQLRKTKDWPGVTGPHTFSENGDVVGKPVVLEQVRNAKFELVSVGKP